MPVIKRKAPPLVIPFPLPEVSGPLLNAKVAQQYLACSHHELRELERRGTIKPIPYLNGRIKPRRYLKSDLDKHIAQQVEKVA